MINVRKLLHVFLGLALMAQSVAVASASRNLNSASDGDMVMEAMADMPCHLSADKEAPAGKPSCCDIRCPDMTTCALGFLAIPTEFSVAVAPTDVVRRTMLTSAPVSVSPQSPLRPPIHSHS